MESVVVYEDEHASIVYGHKSVALGHLKIFPKQNVKSIEELPAKTIAHLFSLATRCASLLFDGLQAQGTNIILNEGKNANQQDDNICIDVIARHENDGLKFTWDPKQGDINQIKQLASDISAKVVVYEKPIAKITQDAKVEQEPIKDDAQAVKTTTLPSPEKFGQEPVTRIETTPNEEPVSEEKPIPKANGPVSEKAPPRRTDDETLFDKKTNFLLYELMRMP